MSTIRVLKQERKVLLQKVKTTQNNAENETKNDSHKKNSKENEVTTRKCMDNTGLTPERRDKLRKVLLCSDVLIRKIAKSRRQTPKGKVASQHRIILGQIVKKCSCLKSIAQKTRMSRHGYRKLNSEDQKVKASSRLTKVRKEANSVINFLKRKDNSRA